MMNNNMDIFPQAVPPNNGVPGASEAYFETLALSDLLRLAAQVHMGGNVATSQTDTKSLMHLIKRRAASELEIGDGLKCETVRVERKLDGTVSIFFGI